MATASRESTPIPREDVGAIVIELSSHIKSLVDEAQAIKKKQNKTSRAADEALNLFFEGMDIGELEDYSGFGHLDIPKKMCRQTG